MAAEGGVREGLGFNGKMTSKSEEKRPTGGERDMLWKREELICHSVLVSYVLHVKAPTMRH